MELPTSGATSSSSSSHLRWSCLSLGPIIHARIHEVARSSHRPQCTSCTSTSKYNETASSMAANQAQINRLGIWAHCFAGFMLSGSPYGSPVFPYGCVHCEVKAGISMFAALRVEGGTIPGMADDKSRAGQHPDFNYQSSGLIQNLDEVIEMMPAATEPPGFISPDAYQVYLRVSGKCLVFTMGTLLILSQRFVGSSCSNIGMQPFHPFCLLGLCRASDECWM